MSLFAGHALIHKVLQHSFAILAEQNHAIARQALR
eukprot:COSAG05_NODE_18624_length_305_cov_1.004854_1_plen_34_part_10